METSSIISIIRTLNDRQVHYLIVGGLAVVAHGYVRFTADLDLVVAVNELNLTRAVEALRSMDFRPRAPVPIESLIDPKNREQWTKEKGMMVFSLFSPAHSATEVDVFLEPPIDFQLAQSRAMRMELAPGVSADFCGLDDLIDMKRRAGRPVDLEDIARLRELRGNEGL